LRESEGEKVSKLKKLTFYSSLSLIIIITIQFYFVSIQLFKFPSF